MPRAGEKDACVKRKTSNCTVLGGDVNGGNKNLSPRHADIALRTFPGVSQLIQQTLRKEK